ncbi:MAG: caspase family protein [Gammaproteobacteria bacterium]|nr:caspase family protein [Gammaproteobacteria bacterium]
MNRQLRATLLCLPLLPQLATAECTLSEALNRYDDLSGVNWQTQQQHCPKSALVNYNTLVNEINLRGLDSALLRKVTRASRQHPNFGPLKSLQQQLRLQSAKEPFAAIAQQAETLLQQWLADYPQPQFSQQPPELPELPPLPELVKGEFETTPQFKARVATAQRQREQQLQQLQRKYDAAVEAYNKAVTDHNQEVSVAEERRQRELEAERKRLLQQAMAQVMGTPKLIGLQYNADLATFNGTLQNSSGSWQQPITIAVPLAQARSFKQAVQEGRVTPKVRFDIGGDTLRLQEIHLPHRGETYAALPAEGGTTQLAEVRVRLQQAAPLQSSVTPVSVSEIAALQSSDESDYFSNALKMEHDPQLARLQQERAELERKQRQALRQQQLSAERKRLTAENRRIEQQLAQMGGNDEYEGLTMKTEWKFPRASKADPETLVVIVGNRSYGKGIPAIPYAHNDAKAFRQFAEITLGVPPENILYEEDASKGVMEGIFRSTLPARINRGKSRVVVYFSGHGMAADGDAMLLPSDARPNTAKITGYSRKTLLNQLAALDAKQVSLFLDACYTGTDKTGAALLEGKPVFVAPVANAVPDNTLLVTAASGSQIAWMDRDRGHSLMTYWLLKGMTGSADSNGDHTIDTVEIQDYLEQKVNREALKLHEQPQQPEVVGRRTVLVTDI